jgi:hypothetical protein
VNAVLHEDAQRKRFGFANQDIKTFPAAHSDESANGCKHAPKCVGALERRGECANPSGAASTNGAIIWVVGEDNLLSVGSGVALDFGKNFLDEESREPVRHAVEFEAPVEAGILRRLGGVDRARRDSDSNGNRHGVLRNEVVEDHRHAEAQAVEPNVHASRFIRLIFGWDVDRDGADRGGKDLRVRHLEFEALARRHAGLRQ